MRNSENLNICSINGYGEGVSDVSSSKDWTGRFLLDTGIWGNIVRGDPFTNIEHIVITQRKVCER